MGHRHHKRKKRNRNIIIFIIVLIIFGGLFWAYNSGYIKIPSQAISVQELNQKAIDFIGKEVSVEGSIDSCDSVLKENLVMACLKDLKTGEKIAITGEGYTFNKNIIVKGILKSGDSGNYIEVIGEKKEKKEINNIIETSKPHDGVDSCSAIEINSIALGVSANRGKELHCEYECGRNGMEFHHYECLLDRIHCYCEK